MTVYVWPQDMKPGFPLATLEYTVHRTGDPMHWHVADVARAIAYTNLSQSYKVFYRSCQMSPGEYRRYYTPRSGEGAHELASAGAR